MTVNKIEKSSHNILIILSSFFLFFLVRIAYFLPNLSHSEQEALSLTGLFIPSSTCVLIAFSDLDLHIFPLSHSASLSLMPLIHSHYLTLLTSHNFLFMPLIISAFL